MRQTHSFEYEFKMKGREQTLVAITSFINSALSGVNFFSQHDQTGLDSLRKNLRFSSKAQDQLL